MIIKTAESSEEESGESEVELEGTPPSHSAIAGSQSADSVSQLQESLLEEEQETNRPLVVNTEPVQDITPNTENLENEEREAVGKFLCDGCGCDLIGGSCSTFFSTDSMESYRRDCSELTRGELDMALLGQLAAFTNNSAGTTHFTRYSHPYSSSLSRQKSYRHFWHGGQRVCRKTFLFLHNISEKR